MINPNDVNLIIFDLDGTILSARKAIYHAVKKAFDSMGLSSGYDEEVIERYFGVPYDDFYRLITPGDKRHLWQKVREKVEEEYPAALQKFACSFPGVTDTLDMLRRRGYRLSLYSNSPTSYFYPALSALGIRDRFDYVECVKENGLTKPELAQKIIEKLGAWKTAIVGDRIHDIDAATATGSLSIGVLYGYGGKEPEQADITISGFPELLDIFDRRLPVFEMIWEEIKRRKQKDKAFIIGVNGIDCSGKSIFADALKIFLVSRECKTQMINLDDFHNPREIRYAGENQTDDYYSRVKKGYSFNINHVVEQLLVPIHQKKSLAIHLTLLNWHTDKYDIEKDFFCDQGTVVIFEGVFLYIKELSPYIDYKVFLDIPFEESKRRAGSRDTGEVYKKYDAKYLPAQRRYLYEFPPSETADMIVDNSDWEWPKVTFRR
jgi:phosphoglycolate phosphatase